MSGLTREAILSLYQNTLRTSRSFSSYNFREYFIRRAENTFRAMQNETDATKVEHLYSTAQKDLEVLQRSAVVNRLYGGWTLAVEQQPQQTTMERGVN